MNKETIQILLIVGVAFLVLFVVVAIAIFAAYFKLWLRSDQRRSESDRLP